MKRVKQINIVVTPEVERAIVAERQRLSKLLHGINITKAAAIRSLLCRPEPVNAT